MPHAPYECRVEYPSLNREKNTSQPVPDFAMTKILEHSPYRLRINPITTLFILL